MQTSTDRIITTHCGSLARPRPLLEVTREKEHGRRYGGELSPPGVVGATTVGHVPTEGSEG